MNGWRKIILPVALAVMSIECNRGQMLDIKTLEDALGNGTPLIENDTTAVFIYKGEAKRVSVSGDMTNWVNTIDLTRFDDTDLFYVRVNLPADARIEYMFIVDDQDAITDPACPNVVLNGLGAHSELAMPAYRYHPVFDSVRDGTPGGYARVQQHLIDAEALGYQKEIYVYTPPGYEETTDRYPTVYIQDGRDYIEFAHTPAVLDYLISTGAIVPVIAVFVSPPNRHETDEPNRVTEYGLNPLFADWMALELVAFVDSRYRTLASPTARMIAGDSFAGLVSVYVPFQYPDVFGISYSQSGYLSLNGGAVIDAFSDSEKKPIRLYVDVGIYERTVGLGWLPDDEIDFTAGNREFKRVLEQKGYDFVYREYPEGHTWGNWRAHLIDAMTHFFPKHDNT